jgi:hypothetical protein
MKLTYILLLSAIIGFALAQNAAEASKCRSNNTTGQCLTCPTDGSTVGGPRKLATNTCATAKLATEQVAAAGALNVMMYGSWTAEGTYAHPGDVATWPETTWCPATSTLFTCKDTYVAVYAATLNTSSCALLTTAITYANGAVPTAGTVTTYSYITTANAAGALSFLPHGSDCINLSLNDNTAVNKDTLVCNRCIATKGLYSGLAAAPQTCTTIPATGWDSQCDWWRFSDNATIGAATGVCGRCVSGSALKVVATQAASCATADAVKLANCYKADSASTSCQLCMFNSWMNGSGICIAAVPSATTKAAQIVASAMALLAALLTLN